MVAFFSRHVLAILINTPPTIFWIIYYIYSHSELLEDLRKEIEPIMTKNIDETCLITRSIEIASTKAKCHLLVSTYQEVLRQCTIGTSIHEVMRETVLNGWLLKKGALIQMPSSVIHRDQALWASDVDDFNSRRFKKDQQIKSAIDHPRQLSERLEGVQYYILATYCHHRNIGRGNNVRYAILSATNGRGLVHAFDGRDKTGRSRY